MAPETIGRRETGSCATSSTAASWRPRHSRGSRSSNLSTTPWAPRRCATIKNLATTETDTGSYENDRYASDPRLAHAINQNDTLRKALREARGEITALREEVDKLSAPPSSYGVY